MKKYKILFLIIIVLLLTSCAAKDDYSFKNYTEKQIIDLFDAHRASFDAVCDALITNDRFWENGRRYEDDGHAFICSPNETKKLSLFSEEQQSILIDFFNTTGPYMISLDYQEYIRITYINADSTAGYVLANYYSVDAKKLDEWIAVTKSNNDVLEDLGDHWYFYYNTTDTPV